MKSKKKKFNFTFLGFHFVGTVSTYPHGWKKKKPQDKKGSQEAKQPSLFD